MRRYGFIIAFFILLAAPVVVHWIYGAANWWEVYRESRGAGRLVIITPHIEDIRNEFKWAFADWHQKKYGQRVELQFLSVGGTTDIRRQLNETYGQIRKRNGGKLPPEDQVDTGIDLAWGGGDFFFNSQLKPDGVLRPIELNPALLAAAFPHPTLAGVKLYDVRTDTNGKALPPLWVGVCLSGFGIIYNPDLCRALDIPPPASWSDLADPKYYGNLSLADPSHSGSAAVAYMMVLQRAMADSEADFFNRSENWLSDQDQLKKTVRYQEALDEGWSVGMGQLVLMAANARFFSDSATQPPNDVAAGDAAGGMAIDFYGRVTEQIVTPERERFVLPAGATAITPDPVAILYGCHGAQLTLARHFVEFLLSPEGQRLWSLKVGEPGGPRVRALHRSPVREDVYKDRDGWADDVDYFADAGGFNQRGEWMAPLADLQLVWSAAWIDVGEDLRSAYGHALAVPDEKRRAELVAELAAIPITRPDVTAMMTERKKREADPKGDADFWKATQRLEWSRKFQDHYLKVKDEAQQAGG